MIVLDASALLVFLFRESGHERVGEVIAESCISSVNLAEVIGRFTRDGHNADRVFERLRDSPLEFAPFLGEDAAIAASLVPQTKPLGLSLADRACIGLALSRSLPVITADRVWQTLQLPVRIETIR